MLVFDSSALIAFVRGEDGADYVAELLDEADVPLYVHAVNLCEVFHGLLRSDGRDFAEATVQNFAHLGVQERSDLDGAFWRDAGELIAARRGAGATLPMGDALGVALARRLGATFVTADRHELLALDAAGVCDFRFIR